MGRDMTAETDLQLNAEMLSYSRTHGLFAGISLQGATLRPDGRPTTKCTDGRRPIVKF